MQRCFVQLRYNHATYKQYRHARMMVTLTCRRTCQRRALHALLKHVELRKEERREQKKILSIWRSYARYRRVLHVLSAKLKVIQKDTN